MSVRQRLYPDTVQVAGMVRHCQDARFVYNIGLEQRSMWRRSKHDRGVSPVYGDLDAARVNTATQMRELAQLRAELPWLGAGSSVVQQAALRDLDVAFTRFYQRLGGYPKFKRRNDRKGGFCVRDLTVRRLNRRWGTVWVPKVGPVRFRITRDWRQITAATSARVSLRNNQWHVSFTTPPPPPRPAGTGAVVGIDRGCANTIATSDHHMGQAPTLTPGEQARFLTLTQRLARQTQHAKTSGRRLSECRNRTKTLDQLAALRTRLDNRRRDWVEQTTTQLARDYDLIAVENLRVPNMVRRPQPRPDPTQPGAFLPNGARAKAALNKAILANLWGRIHTRLDQKTPTGHLVAVNPANTSRTCANCGHCAPGNRESQAVFQCKTCGHQAHADTNAAINILARALPTNPRTFGGSPAPDPPQEPPTGATPKDPDTP